MLTSPIALLEANLCNEVRAVEAILGTLVSQARRSGRKMSLLSARTRKQIAVLKKRAFAV